MSTKFKGGCAVKISIFFALPSSLTLAFTLYNYLAYVEEMITSFLEFSLRNFQTLVEKKAKRMSNEVKIQVLFKGGGPSFVTRKFDHRIRIIFGIGWLFTCLFNVSETKESSTSSSLLGLICKNTTKFGYGPPQSSHHLYKLVQKTSKVKMNSILLDHRVCCWVQ